MDASLNNYLESLMPNWNYKESPLYRAELNNPEEQPFNYLANKIFSDMSKVSFDETKHLTEFMCQVFKLNTMIEAYGFIESEARYRGAPEGMVNELTDKEFTEYRSSLRRLGLVEEQFEDVADTFQRLSMVDVPKGYLCEYQIEIMITLVKAYLTNNKLDIDSVDNDGNTQFYTACMSGEFEKAKILLSLGCNPNIPGLLHTACNKGMTELVDFLIKEINVDTNIRYKHYPPLYVACNNGFDKIVSIIVNSKKKVNLYADYYGKTPFKVAIAKGNENCARVLLEAGVDINAKDESGCTLFEKAVIGRNLKKIKLLLSLGCNPNILNSMGATPFYLACNKGMTEIVDFLIKEINVDPNIKCHGCPPIYPACEFGHNEIVSIIAKSKRSDLNATYNDFTPFAISIYRGHEVCARILVEEGANVTFDINNNETPLLHANNYGFENLTSIIAKKNQIDIRVMRLDLHNIANVFNQVKFKPTKNFLLSNNYSFANLETLLNCLDEKEKNRDKILDSFCSSIVASIKKGSFQEFISFLDHGKNFYNSIIEYIIYFLKIQVDETIVNIMQRYEQILPVEIENAKGLKNLDKLKLAYLIEIEIPKIKYASHTVFSQKDGKYPRTVIVEKGSQQMFILAKKQFSIISGEGGFKYVKSILLVPQNKSVKAERIVYAKTIEKTKMSALGARKEYELIKDFSGLTGFGRAYKCFCFDKNGNYLNKQQLKNKQEEEIRSAIVLEEMEGDFHKVVKQLTLNEQISVAKQLVEAINVMMRKEKVSWDLKLHNVLFRRDVQSNEIKIAIMDLGNAHNIRQDRVKKISTYSSPWYGAPELLYATDVVDDAKGYLQCEMWALGLVMYNICFGKDFPLIDNKFSHKYKIYRHLPVVNQVAHYALSYNEYVQKHNDLVEEPLKYILLIPKEARTTEQNLKILTYRMLQLDRNVRINPTDAQEFCKDLFIVKRKITKHHIFV